MSWQNKCKWFVLSHHKWRKGRLGLQKTELSWKMNRVVMSASYGRTYLQNLTSFRGRFKDVRAKIFQHWFFPRLLSLKVDELLMSEMSKKHGGSPTSFSREQAWKIALNLKNRATLAKKATMSVSLKIIQLNLWSEMFSAKYCSSRPTKWD